MRVEWTIWNVDTARPVRAGLSKARALRYAGILEVLFGQHYTVVQ